MAMVDSALAHERLGMSVFPVLPRDKVPAIAWEACQRSRAPADRIRLAWEAKPDANIGIATGPASGVFVVDVDGDEGAAALADLERRHGSLPTTWRAKTARGEHIYLRWPAGRIIRNSAGKLGTGLDTRGQGGFVVAPGSVHPSGFEYEWMADHDPAYVPLADAPAWLLDLLDPPKIIPKTTGINVSALFPDREDAYVRAAVDREAGRVIHAQEGARNDALNRAAYSLGQFVGSGKLSEQEASGTLTRAALAAGLSQHETERTIASGLAAGRLEPRNVPASSAPPHGSPSPAAPKEGLCVRTVADALSAPERPYLVKGIAAQGDLSITSGDPGCGKTYLWLRMAWAVAQGQSIFGRKVNQAPVIYLALEGEGAAVKRIKAFAQHYGTAESFFYIAQPINMREDLATVGQLIDIVNEKKAGLVIADTYARALSGGGENDPADTGAVIANVDLVRHQTGAHVAFIHHGTKSGEKGPRGHGSLAGAADLLLHVTNDEGNRTVEVLKARDDPGDYKLGFALRQVEIGTDKDGDAITACLVDEASPGNAPIHLTPAEERAMDALREAMIDGEQPITPSRHVPNSITKCVNIELWRQFFYAKSAGHSSDARQKAFKRAADTLADKGVIGIWKEEVWFTR